MTKTEIIVMLLKAGNIDFEQALILYEKEKEFVPYPVYVQQPQIVQNPYPVIVNPYSPTVPFLPYICTTGTVSFDKLPEGMTVNNCNQN